MSLCSSLLYLDDLVESAVLIRFTGVDTDLHSATLSKGVIGVVHGASSYIIQSATGQLTPTHSISAGMSMS